MRPNSSAFNGTIPVRFDGAPWGPLAGQTFWRGAKDFSHSHLCRILGLDSNRFHFDLPSTVRGVGANLRGFDGGGGRRRIINGFVFMTGLDKPVGKLTIIPSFDKFRDVDPTDERDFYDLSSS